MTQGADRIDYALLVREALREVPRQVLLSVAASGLPGDHHFFLTFRTDSPKVVMPRRLRQQHPAEMTVVIQHLFSGLLVDHDGFSVTLRFSGRPEQIYVPFDSLIAFVDPAAQFGLRFEAEETGASTSDAVLGEAPNGEMAQATAEMRTTTDEPFGEHESDGNVVSIGRFRKK